MSCLPTMDLSTLGDLPDCSVSECLSSRFHALGSLLSSSALGIDLEREDQSTCVAVWCSPVTEECLCPQKQPQAVPWDDDLLDCLNNNCTFGEQIGRYMSQKNTAARDGDSIVMCNHADHRSTHLVTAGVTYKICGIPQAEISLIPLIVVTFTLQLLAFSIRVWYMRIRSQKWGYDDVSITVAFVSPQLSQPCIPIIWVPLSFGPTP